MALTTNTHNKKTVLWHHRAYNAAMIAITGYYKYQKGEFIGMDVVPFARMDIRV